DEGGEAHGVAAGEGGVGFALIPDDAAQGTGDEGGDHAVVEAAGGAVAGDAARGLGRGGLEGGAGGLGVGPGFFPLGAEGLVGGEFLGGGARGLVEFGVGGGELGGGAVGVGGDPRGDGGAADGAVEDADGHAEFLMQGEAEVVGDAAELAGGLGHGLDPGALGAGRGVAGGLFADLELAEQGEIGGADLGLGVGAVGEGPAHVGLAGGAPDFGDDRVADGVGVGALNNVGATGGGGGQRGEVDAPGAVGAGGGGEGLGGEAHRDAF